MTLDTSDSTWRCKVDGCTVVARRKEDQPIHHKPEFSLEMSFRSDDEAIYHIITNIDGKRVALDVSDYVDMVIDEQTNSVTLCLLFNRVIRKHS